MNFRLLAKYLGHFLAAIGLLMLPSALWAPYFGEWKTLIAFIEAMALTLAAAGLLSWLGRHASRQLFHREALALVGVGWLLTAWAGSLPYIMAGLLNPVDAYFESMSGFTTTGSTVLIDIEGAPKSLLFWRSFTHWLGGMGIIVLFIAVLPYLGAGGKQLFKSESPGPDPRGLRPRIKDTASILYKIYFGLTVLETALLMLAGMSLFDALCHTFGTLATGGFSPRADSVAAFDSVAVDSIIIVFMILAGTNFGLFFAMLRGNWKASFRDTEWRVYMLVLLLATLLVTFNLMGAQVPPRVAGAPGPPAADMPEYGFSHALRMAAFQVVSIMTTTGYCTANFEVWPYFSRALLLVLMFVGGCAGSTGGGLKVVRVVMLLKMAYWKLEGTFRPKTIRPIRISGQIIDEELQRTVYVFFVLHLLIFAGGTVFMSLLGLPLQTALSSVAATLNNIGPGLEHVGAIENFHFIPAVGKLFLSLCMVMGRLELYSICVLFIPGFWRRS
jgi:trk system potassium uptake protein